MTALTRSHKGRAVSEQRRPAPVDGWQTDLVDGPEYMKRADELQLFPSHPWSVRAMLDTLGPRLFRYWPEVPASIVAYENCAGKGHMVEPLREYFPDVRPSDIEDWGKGYPIADALTFEADSDPCDSFLITNAPFDKPLKGMAEKIVRQAQKTCDNVIVLQRLSFICGQGRHALHYDNPLGNLKHFMPCTERTPMQLGHYNPACSKPQEYAWFHYQRNYTGLPVTLPIPPGSREKFFRPEDVRI
ncbi:MAG: hypothetical protein QM645_11750 [Asticcacaulis sp.]